MAAYPFANYGYPADQQMRTWDNWVSATNTSTTLNIQDWLPSGTATPTANSIWYNWVQAPAGLRSPGSNQPTYRDRGTTATVRQQAIWDRWTATYTYTLLDGIGLPMPAARTIPAPAQVIRERTPEEVEADRSAGAALQRRLDEQAREQREACARAEALLLAHLSPAQEEEYARDQAFHVRSRSGRLYLVRRGWIGNVLEVTKEDKGGGGTVEQDVAVAEYCIHPYESVPYEDNMLAQKLLLEDAGDGEAEFHRIANRTPLRVAG